MIEQMVKFILTVLGIVCFGLGSVMSLEENELTSEILLCYVIGILCLGFIGMIEAIEKQGEK